jgi:CTP synthase
LYDETENIELLVKSKNPLVVMERHRHRYEFNNQFRQKYAKSGLIFSGISPDQKLVEAIELPTSVHPFFIGVQFHPEYKSRLLTPHPIFLGFVKAATEMSKD